MADQRLNLQKYINTQLSMKYTMVVLLLLSNWVYPTHG
jgi:hypothetical protein